MGHEYRVAKSCLILHCVKWAKDMESFSSQVARKLVICSRNIASQLSIAMALTVQWESLAGRMFGKLILFKCLAKKVWQMNRSAKGLLIVTTNLDGFSLANIRQFAKFAKLSTRQTFPLYGIYAPTFNSTLHTAQPYSPLDSQLKVLSQGERRTPQHLHSLPVMEEDQNNRVIVTPAGFLMCPPKLHVCIYATHHVMALFKFLPPIYGGKAVLRHVTKPELRWPWSQK